MPEKEVQKTLQVRVGSLAERKVLRFWEGLDIQS
jgi:hypothetical protein